MKIVLQRVTYAQVKVDGEIVGQIDQGYLALVGFTSSDTVEIVEKMANKMIGLRVFSDHEDKMNLALEDVNGAILSISQFTLYADSKKGRRPSFIQAAKGEAATLLYNHFNTYIKNRGVKVETGIFGADMKIELLNDGPVTIILDSNEIL